jgi:hypothetical protein
LCIHEFFFPSDSGSADIDHHPGPAIAALMKLSFDEEHRHAICTLGKGFSISIVITDLIVLAFRGVASNCGAAAVGS